ncbi:MAG: agarase, partial [Planctomycetes bacterium]|nr:agarase [Planctomycetota bacterium]
RGLPRGGLVHSVPGQAERAGRYAAYVAGAMRHPAIVGTHWFQYRDEPATGRKLDGENFQIGFVDVADRPYPELVDAARGLAAGMYRARAGR